MATKKTAQSGKKAKDHITLRYPDGSAKDFKKGITGAEIAKEISEGLLRKSVGILLDEEAFDLNARLEKSGSIRILTFNDDKGKDIFRHSSAHLMAQAVGRLYPEAKLTIGPVVEEGFYYDIDHPPFKEEDLAKIEMEMSKIVKEDLPISRKEIPTKVALQLFKDNPYKQEIIKNIEEFGEGKTDKSDTVSIYTQGEFSDLCRGPHLPRTGMVKAFKLTKIAGAYWRGDAKNKQLQRIYGISFPESKDLTDYLKLIEEAEKRDHRKLGKELDLFMMHEWALAGCAFFLPKGTILYNELLKFIRNEYSKRGYEEVITPQIFKKEMWETSGHWEHYSSNMFTMNINGHDYSLKPMNCPSHLLIYKSKSRSYRELPLRIADFCVLHRNELGGVLGGLTRVVKFSQDDAHIFLAPEQIEDEIIDLLGFVKYVYVDTFKFTTKVKLSTRPADSIGDSALWDNAENALRSALMKEGMAFEVKEGEGAFYGPKIDFDVKDSLGRDWQLATIQLDFQMPLRFGAEYEGSDGKKHTVVMVHRAILGSVERFIGVLIEHFAGKFPLWLSPVQVKVLPIADRHQGYTEKVVEQLKGAGIRAEADFRAETTSKKVREAQLERVNYILVVGDKESETDTVNVRTRDGVVHGQKKLFDLIKELTDEINEKR